MKIISKIKNNIFMIYVIINILYLLIGSFLFNISKTITMKQFSEGYIVLLIVNTFIILLLLIFKKYNYKKIDIFLIFISIFAFISYLFAYKPHAALYGAYHRYEGLFTILYYMTLLFISSFVKKDSKRKITYFILLAGMIELIYAFCQKSGIFNIVNIDNQLSGFTNNPNFFATLILICLSISIGLFFDSQNKKRKIMCIILSSTYMIGLLFANTTSCMVGLIFVLIYLFVYSKKNKQYNDFKYIIVTIIIITTLITIFGLTNQVKDLIIALGQGTDVALGHSKPQYGTSRIYIWTKTLSVLPKYWLHGIGIDNMKYLIDGKPIPYWLIIDKCHNEYLQILITMGIFSLISYLALYYNIVREGIKSSLRNRELYLILPVIGYLIQAFFNISVIEVAPLFYIILGLNIDRYKA